MSGRVNYVLGSDPSRWQLGLRAFQKVRYAGLYPGIDVVYYGNQQSIEFDLELSPHADPSRIRLRFHGAERVHLDLQGALVLGPLRMLAPHVHQNGRAVPSRYRLLEGGDVGFELEDYDRNDRLTIDPTLVLATVVGGGTQAYIPSASVALDRFGNMYVAGTTYSLDFPVVGNRKTGYQDNGDGFVLKLDPAGSTLIYATYFGGTAYDQISGVAVDSKGFAWVSGASSSSDFPLMAATQSSLAGLRDAVILRVAPDGSLAYSTFLGGPASDDARAVCVDLWDNVFCTGTAGPGFPTTPGGLSEAVSGASTDAFAVKLAGSGSVVWSTLIGGTGAEFGTGIAVDPFGNPYVTGSTTSSALSGAPPPSGQATNKGSFDAFVAKLNWDASRVVFWSLLGGSKQDVAVAISVDATGSAMIAGSTQSEDFPTTLSAFQRRFGGGLNDGFVAKFNTSGSQLSYSSFLGGNRSDMLTGLAAEPNGTYVVGSTDSVNFPTVDALQMSGPGNRLALHRSSDQGRSWAPLDATLPGLAYAVASSATVTGAVLAATDGGLYRSANGGLSWIRLREGLNTALVVSARTPSILYSLENYFSVLRSIDGGNTWTTRGILPSFSNEFRIDPSDPNTLYAFAPWDSRAFRSTDAGATWSPFNTPSNVRIAALTVGGDGALYLGVDDPGLSLHGVYKSSDKGTSWSPINSGLPPNTRIAGKGLVAAPTDPQRLYATDYFTLFVSRNAGASWSSVGPLPGGTIELTVSPFNADILFYAAYNAEASAWMSANGGVTWVPAVGLGTAQLSAIIADPVNPLGVYGLSTVLSSPVVAKVKPDGSGLIYASYFGGSGQATAAATAGDGGVTVAGSAAVSFFPSIDTGLRQSTLNGGLFVARIADATQPCQLQIDTSPRIELWFSHNITIPVVAPSGCGWSVTSDVPWATVNGSIAGSGIGSVTISLLGNSSNANRVAQISIGGKVVRIEQRSGFCAYNSFTPGTLVVSGAGGSVAATLQAADGCKWTLPDAYPWAVTSSSRSGVGSTPLSFSVSPNLSRATRTMNIDTGQGGRLTITQAGTTASSVVARIQSMPDQAEVTVAGSGCIPGVFTTPANLTWDANANCQIRFTTPRVVTGADYQFQSARVNGGSPSTTNPLVVNAGTSNLVVDAAFVPTCTFSIAPDLQDASAAGGLTIVKVQTQAGCRWSVTSNVSWFKAFTITAGGSAPVGPGGVNVVADPNNGPARTGTALIAGKLFTLRQPARTCTYSISPASYSFPSAGGGTTVQVITQTGCPWQAETGDPWLAFPSGSSGSGNGTLTVKAATLVGGLRTGAVRIGGKTFEASQGVDYCGAIDVGTSVRVIKSSPTYIYPSTYNFHQTLTVRNGETPLNSVYLVLVGQPNHQPYPNGTGLLGNQLLTRCRSSNGYHLVPVGSLGPGESKTISLVFFSQSLTLSLQYSTKVLAGMPSK